MDDWTDIVRTDWLSRRLTLDEYFAEQLGRETRPANSQLDMDRAALEARARFGDEWWERIAGSLPLRQIGGIALVRDGQVVWARDDWIS